MRGRRGGAYSSTAGTKSSHRIENSSEWSSNTWNDGHPEVDEEPVCPLCIELLDETEIRFRPCPCGYRVCLFCYERIKRDLFGLCPSCRTPYGAPKSDSPTPGPSKPKPPPPYTKPQPVPPARATAGPPPTPPHHAPPAALAHVFPTPSPRTKAAWSKGASPPKPPLARAPWGLPPPLPATSSKPAWTQNAVPPGAVAWNQTTDRVALAGSTPPGKTWATNGALPAAAPGRPAAPLTAVQSSWHHVPSSDRRKAVGPASSSVEGWGSLGAGGVESSRANLWEGVGRGNEEEAVLERDSGNSKSDLNGSSFGFSELWGLPNSASKPLVPAVGQGLWDREREGGGARGVGNGAGGLGLGSIGRNDELADLLSSLRVRNGISVLQQQFREVSVSMRWSAEEMQRARESVEASRREARGGQVAEGSMENWLEAWGGAGVRSQVGVDIPPSAGNRRGGDMAAFVAGGNGSRPTSSLAHTRPCQDSAPETAAVSSNHWPSATPYLPLSLSRPPTPGSSSHSQPSTPGEGGLLHGRGGLDSETEFSSRPFPPAHSTHTSLSTSPASALAGLAGLAGAWGSIPNSQSSPGSIPFSPRFPRAATISGPMQPMLTGGSLSGLAGDGVAISSSPPTRPRSSGLSASAGVFVPQSLTLGRSQSQGATPASLRDIPTSLTVNSNPILTPTPSNQSLSSPRWSSLFSISSGRGAPIPIPTPISHLHPVPAAYASRTSTPTSTLAVSLGLGFSEPPSTSGGSIWAPLDSVADEGSLPSPSRIETKGELDGQVYRAAERDFRNLGPIGFRSGSRVGEMRQAESGGGGGLGRTPAPYRPPLEGQVAQMPWGGGGPSVGASGGQRGLLGDSLDTNGFRNPLDELYGGRVDPPIDPTFGRNNRWAKAPIGSSRGLGSRLQECSICRAFSTFSQVDLDEHIELCQAAAMLLD